MAASSARIRLLRLVAIQLALVVAAVHLFWGIPKLVTYLAAGVMPDPRPAMFVVSSVALVGGVAALNADLPARPLYGLGIALMIVYLVGYVGWHLGGHGSIFPWVEGYGHTHQGPVATVMGHLLDDPLAMLSVAAELALAVVLGALLVVGE